MKLESIISIILCIFFCHYRPVFMFEMRCSLQSLWTIRECNIIISGFSYLYNNILAITRKHSVKPWQVVEIADKIGDDLMATKAALSAARRDLADAKIAAATPDEKGNLLFFEDEMDGNIQRGMADGGADHCTGICGVFSATDSGYRYVCVSRGIALREIGKNMNAKLNGRGGGTDAIIQGTLGATREQIEAFFAQICNENPQSC